MQSQSQALDDSFLEIREKELNNITKSINDLNQLFRDISEFVVEQGTILDQIEYNVDMAAVKTEEGLSQLKKADSYQKKDRKMKAIFCMAITVFILFILLIIKSAVFN
jgi:syntaxin 16